MKRLSKSTKLSPKRLRGFAVLTGAAALLLLISLAVVPSNGGVLSRIAVAPWSLTASIFPCSFFSSCPYTAGSVTTNTGFTLSPASVVIGGTVTENVFFNISMSSFLLNISGYAIQTMWGGEHGNGSTLGSGGDPYYVCNQVDDGNGNWICDAGTSYWTTSGYVALGNLGTMNANGNFTATYNVSLASNTTYTFENFWSASVPTYSSPIYTQGYQYAYVTPVSACSVASFGSPWNSNSYLIYSGGRGSISNWYGRYCVTNYSGNAIFIPMATPGEWNNFAAQAPNIGVGIVGY